MVRQTVASMVALFAAIVLLLVGSGLLGTLLSLRMTLGGYSDSVVGIVMGAFYGGMLLGVFLCYRIVRRVGHIRAFGAFAAVNTACVMGHALYLSAPVWFGLRLLTGVTMMGMYIVVESWLNERSPAEVRGRVFSLYIGLSAFALGLGQFGLRLADVTGPELFFAVGILFALCVVPVTLTRAAHPQPPQKVDTNFRILMGAAPFGIGGALAGGLVNGAFFALGPVFTIGLGLPVDRVAVVMGTMIISGLALQWPVGHLSDFYDRRSVLGMIAFAVAAVAALVAVFGGTGYALLLMMVAVLGGFAATLYPVAVAHVHDHVDHGDMVSTSGTMLVVYGAGAAIGPVAAAVFMDFMGATGLFWFVAGVAILFGLTTFFRRRYEPVGVEEQEPFLPMAQTSPVMAELDPRIEEEEAVHEETSAREAAEADSPPSENRRAR